MRWSSPFFNTHPARAILETLVTGLALWFTLLLLKPFLSSLILRLGICLGIGLICVIFSTLRLQLPGGSNRRQLLFEASAGSIVSFLLACVELPVILFLLQGVSLNPLWRGSSRPLLTVLIGLLLNVAVFSVVRAGVRLWLLWAQLRHRQLLWSLTHAHVMILVLGAGLLLIVFEALIIYNSPDVFLVVSSTLGLIVLALIALLVVLPLSALFSYLVMRRTTDRIKSLATATSTLRGGDYAVRVPVAGEDEVAQLQTDFNMMAIDLERSVRELRQERDRVATLLQQRRELVANVSHELRTPVATVRGYLETTLMHWEEQSRHSSQSPPTLYHDLTMMEHEVIRLQTLVEDLFTLASAEVGKLTLRCEPTNVGALIQRIVETATPLIWRTNKIELVADMPAEPTEPVVALVDAMRLEQALQNLLHNAVRHTSPGGIIAFVACAEAQAVVLQVKDTGEGIAPEDLPHIWERFYQANHSHTSVSGAGLGLAMVKELIEEMGGTVAVESVVGEGSCFTLRLQTA